MRRHRKPIDIRCRRENRPFWVPGSWSAVILFAAAFSGPVIFNVTLAVQRAARADEPAKPPALPEADKDGWRPLFDGKTLAGWKSTNFGGEGDVYVEDGAIGFNMGNPLTGVTWTGAPLPKVNYEVEFEGRKVKGGDFFCALTFPYRETHASLVLGGWGGAVIGMSSIDGNDASENETTDYFKFEHGQWYKVRLKVTDETITAWIDDEQIFSVETADKRISTRIEVDPSKPFGFCSFETQGEIRHVRLRELPPAKAE